MTITSGTPDPNIRVGDVIRWLGVSQRTLHKMVQQDLLHPRFTSGRGQLKYFSAREVANLHRQMQKGVSLATAYHQSLRAVAMAYRAERTTEQIAEILGVNYITLPTDDSYIHQLLNAARKVLERPTENMDAADVRSWAKTLSAVTSHYLRLVAAVTGSPQPWTPLLATAAKLLQDAPVHRYMGQPNLATAYGLLEAARRSLRQEAYFYCRGQFGAESAGRAFPEVRNVNVNIAILELL